MDYWKECIEAALEDAGIEGTTGQVESIANDVRIAHEQYGMCHGHDAIPNPLRQRVDSLEKDLAEERSKRTCTACNGTGVIVDDAGFRSSTTRCDRCNGNGRV